MAKIIFELKTSVTAIRHAKFNISLCILILGILVLFAIPRTTFGADGGSPATILDIADMSSAGHTRVLVRLSDTPEFKDDKLASPDRFYIDLKNTVIPKRLKRQLATAGLVKEIRVGQFNPTTARLVFDVSRPDYKAAVRVIQTPPGLEVNFIGRGGDQPTPTSREIALSSDMQASNPANAPGAQGSIKSENSSTQDLEKAVRLSPNDDRLHFRLSQEYSVSNQPKKALAEIEKAVELVPDNVEYLRALAQLANWNGKSDLAARTYKKLLLISHGADDAVIHDLAESEMWSGDLDSAARDFRTYTGKNPGDKKALIEYAEAEGWRGNYAGGLSVLEKYRDRFGETTEYKKTKARLLAWADRPTHALALAQPLLRETPDDYGLNYSRTIALHYANRPVEMIGSLETTQRLQPELRESADLRLFTTVDIRSNIEGASRIYADSDHLGTYATSLRGTYFLRPDTGLKAGVDYEFLHAEKGSGLEKVDGGTSENYVHGWIGFEHRLSPLIGFEGHMGSSSANGQSIPSYYLGLNLRLADSFAVKLERNYDYYLVSPRTVSLGIKEGLNRLKATWKPDLLYTVDTSVAYNTLTDNNRFWDIFFGPRRSVMRTAKFNLDIGVNGSWLSFDKQPNDGYYSPELYQKYGISQFGYWKINDENGLSVVTSEAVLKDNTMSGFRFGFDSYVEGTFGIYSDWMLKVTGGISDNMRQATGAFRAYAAGVSLMHRF